MNAGKPIAAPGFEPEALCSGIAYLATSAGARARSGPVPRADCRRDLACATVGRGYVSDASRMLSIECLRMASNSSSPWCADSPSVRAREKLAIMP